MLYARRFGAPMPIVSFVTTLVAAYLIRPYVEESSPERWQLLLLLIGLLLLFLVFVIVYSINLVLIRLTGARDLTPILVARWRETFLSDTLPSLPVETYLDRVAQLQIWISMPLLLRQVVTGLLSHHKTFSDSLQRTLHQHSNQNHLAALISTLGNQWKAPTDFVRRPPALIDDPIHGCITLDSDLSTLLAQPIVRRLSRVKQLSFSYTHFPSATHSRLSHVLGVAHNVERALTGIFDRGVYYELEAAEPSDLPGDILDQRSIIIRRAKLLALLHDLGHGPFGHALDNYVGWVNKHRGTANPDKVYSKLYLKHYVADTLRRLGFDPEDLLRTLDPDERAFLVHFEPLIGDLIDSSMDVDRMDYLIRDAHMTGLSMGFTNADALMQCARPLRSEGRYLLAYDKSGVEYMEHLLYAREAMYRSCYEHPRKRAAERLLERLVREIAADDPDVIDDLYILTDEELLCVLRLVNLRSERAKRLLEHLVANSDYAVLHEVQTNSKHLSDEARVWVSGAVKGKGKQSYVDQPAQWEDAISRASIGADRSFQIQVIVPPASAYEQKRFDPTTILLKDDRGLYCAQGFFELVSGVKDVLSAMNPARARIRVMCSTDLSHTDREKIKQASIAELGY